MIAGSIALVKNNAQPQASDWFDLKTTSPVGVLCTYAFNVV